MSKKTFQFKSPQKFLIESLIDLNRLHSPTASENYTRFTFFANEVCTFQAYLERMKESRGVAKLSYDDAMNISLCLSEQLFHLEKRGVTYLTLSENNVYVVDETTFICLDEDILPLQTNRTVKITAPFSKKANHIAPELEQIDKLPATASHTCVYYSLGSLVSSYLTCVLVGTKLDSFLQRCLEIEPKERSLLYI
jgi:hypothetical protein